jgi:hypothetical protein
VERFSRLGRSPADAGGEGDVTFCDGMPCSGRVFVSRFVLRYPIVLALDSGVYNGRAIVTVKWLSCVVSCLLLSIFKIVDYYKKRIVTGVSLQHSLSRPVNPPPLPKCPTETEYDSAPPKASSSSGSSGTLSCSIVK